MKSLVRVPESEETGKLVADEKDARAREREREMRSHFPPPIMKRSAFPRGQDPAAEARLSVPRTYGAFPRVYFRARIAR
jgi:hypothetical protein